MGSGPPKPTRSTQVQPTRTQPKDFSYSPLQSPDEIRVVTLVKGKRRQNPDSIQCYLAHGQLRPPTDAYLKTPRGRSCEAEGTVLLNGRLTQYKALSYEWGSCDNKETIFLNGCEFKVWRNLYNALCHLRSPKEDLVLWIDQLCINQNNLTERGHQLRKMSQIYRSAHGVVLWLGLSQRVAAQLKIVAEAGRFTEKPVEATMKEIYRCTIWRRAWIWQEIFFARNFLMQCGDQRVPGWYFVQTSIKLFPELRNMPMSPQSSDLSKGLPGVLALVALKHDEFDRTTRTSSFGNDLVELLLYAMADNVQCKNPRDFIYALMAIPDWKPGPWAYITTDYSAPLRQLYEETVRYAAAKSYKTKREDFALRLAKRLGLQIDAKSIEKLVEPILPPWRQHGT
ncbi:hypothetical protein PENPOL_c005G03019 [Penicillium polonicum]|uniref:Heterokaryon incompatibility domain-containing protein n=1 Tax=Penicillium polonicum TaxID=60169 RepID=A0A1V6NN09_PENPO|nr:hypothetical protein PENPOL_c005G03019 [Penicillium polonicum]